MSGLAQVTVTVLNKNGLHARPSSVLAEAALRYADTVIRIRRDGNEVDAKSIIELLMLEAGCGTQLTLQADGPEAEKALRELEQLFEREFDLKL